MIYKIYKVKEILKKILPSFIKKIIPQHLRDRLYYKIFPFYFIPTNKDTFPKKNFVDNYNNINDQIKFIEKFNFNLKQNSEMTYPNLIELLMNKFKKDEKINFLDIGGEYIDFYLHLNKSFKNVDYYFLNLKNINNTFEELKKKYNYKNLFIIDEINKAAKTQFDFINLGASIQYIKDYDIILENITKYNSFILFSGIPIYRSNNENFSKHMIVKQARHSDGNFLYFFNKDFFFNYFKKKNFSLIFEKNNSTDNVNFDNFKKIVEEIEYLDLLFKK